MSSENPHAMWVAQALSRADLSPIRRRDLAELEAMSTSRELADGEVLVRAGSDVERVFVPTAGQIHLLRDEGGARRVVGVVRPFGVVGDIPLLCGRPTPFDAVAVGETAAIELQADELLELLGRTPSLCLRWTVSVARRMGQTQQRLLGIISKDLRQGIATLLLLERDDPSITPTVVQLTQEVIANLLGTRRQTVSRILGELEQDGLVRRGYGATLVLDAVGLAEVADIDSDEAECEPAWAGPRS